MSFAESLAKLFSLMDPNSPERVAFVSRALKWSSGGSGKLGHPRLHQLLARTLWKGRPWVGGGPCGQVGQGTGGPSHALRAAAGRVRSDQLQSSALLTGVGGWPSESQAAAALSVNTCCARVGGAFPLMELPVPCRPPAPPRWGLLPGRPSPGPSAAGVLPALLSSSK